MTKSFHVSYTIKGGRQAMPKTFPTLEAAKALLNLPGVAFGTIYSNYIGGVVLFNTDPDTEAVS